VIKDKTTQVAKLTAKVTQGATATAVVGSVALKVVMRGALA